MREAIGPVRAVTLSVSDLAAARRLYEGQLGMRPLAEWEWRGAESPGVARLWGVPEDLSARAVWLEQPGAGSGAIRLLQFAPVSPRAADDGARPYDHGLVKNLDFFSDDVAAAYRRLSAAGFAFPTPPVRYRVPWGGDLVAHEAHSEAFEGVKLSIAKLEGAPRKAFGEAGHGSAFSEVAVAAQVVADFARAERFYREAFDCVPAAEIVVDDPALVAALRLPARTRLRLAFIGPARAVGGKIGLIAYEGTGVADARSLAGQARPPHRGAVMLSFETDDVDARHALALACGAMEVAPPRDLELPPWGGARCSSVRSPDGVTLELVEPLDALAARVRLCDASELAPGKARGFAIPGLGRVVAARCGDAFLALADRCPHLGGPLSKGSLEGRLLTCPWHGWRVDLATGRVVGGGGACARRYAVRRVGDALWLRLPPA